MAECTEKERAFLNAMNEMLLDEIDTNDEGCVIRLSVSTIGSDPYSFTMKFLEAHREKK
jgi:hypothetical protein